MAWLVRVWVLGTFLATAYVLVHGFPEKSGAAVVGLVVAMSNGAILILNYYFGSSKSSADKTELLKPGGGQPPKE